MHNDWFQQQTDKPLYPDVLWSKPETARGAGKLLIIGGSATSFAHVAQCYQIAGQSGAGTVRVLVPDSLAKLTKHVPNIEYAPSNPSGGFARNGLSDLLDASAWADGILLAGDMGKNSETSVLIDTLLTKLSSLIVIDSSAHESFSLNYPEVLMSANNVIHMSFEQLQQCVIQLKSTQAVTSDTGIPKLGETLHTITEKHPATIVLEKGSVSFVCKSGQVTMCNAPASSARTAVWALQQPTKSYEAIVSSCINITHAP